MPGTAHLLRKEHFRNSVLEEESLLIRLINSIKQNRMWILILLLISVISSFLLVYTGCIAILLIPLIIFGISYFLKERKPKRYFIYGFVVAIFTLIIGNVVLTYLFVSSPNPIVSGSSNNVTLTDGIVEPRFGGSSDFYNFTVVYTNLDAVNSTDVDVTLVLFEFSSDTKTRHPMMKNTSGPASSGWPCHIETPVSEGVYWYYFNTTTYTGTNITYAESDAGFGPINASVFLYYWVFLPIVALSLILPISLYFLIVGMYWWTEKAKQMRGGLPELSKKKEKEETGEFECSNCGAVVSSYAPRCPRCLAVFEEEEETKKRARKVRKGTEIETKDSTKAEAEQEKKKE